MVEKRDTLGAAGTRLATRKCAPFFYRPRFSIFGLQPAAQVEALADPHASHALRAFLKSTDLGVFADGRQVSSLNHTFIFTDYKVDL